MDDRERKKALFRAKLNEKQQKKRIDSPLVRYNDQDRPVCRVCDVVLKSDSDWIAHQASRKHHEAINNLKASASKKNAVNNPKTGAAQEIPKPPEETKSVKPSSVKAAVSSDAQKSRPSSALPPDFFDNQDVKRQKAESGQADNIDVNKGNMPSKAAIPSKGDVKPARVADNVNADDGPTQVKGALPEGFFDNKEADLRARGIEPVKPDIKDEYKEFEKSIQENLAEVDNRFEEEEIDAAEQIEEEEIIEQRTYRDRVEMLKRKKAELLSAKSSKSGNASDATGTKSGKDGSSSSDDDDDDDDDDESFTVDWRAQHL